MLVPLSAVATLSTVTTTVSAPAGGAGVSLDDTTLSAQVVLHNNGTEPVEFQVDASDWRLLPISSDTTLDVDLSTSTIQLRRAASATADGYVRAEITSRTGEHYTAGEIEQGWDDLRFPVQGINPAGAADAPVVDTNLTGFTGTLLFSGSAENIIAGIAQMPHAWARGTEVHPHIHWSKPVGSASAVVWQLYYRHLSFAGEAPGAWVGPVAGTLAAGNQENANEHLITSFGSIDMTDKKESACLCWQLRRQGSSDADNGTARLYEFDIHYKTAKKGTVSEFPA